MINAFLITLISGLSTMLGTLFIFIKIDENKIYKFITFTLSFSMAIMIGLSIFELIPTSFFNIIYNYGVEKGQYLIFFIIILGYFLVNIIIHKLNSFKTNDLYKLGLLSCITLIIHNLPEG